MELKEAIEKAEIMIDAEIIGGGLEKAIQTLIDHAKKSMEPLEGDALVGREVQYLGQDFTIIKYSTINNDYLIDNGRLRIWVKREKFRLIE